MKRRIITEQILADFAIHLQKEEKSENTVQKYLRDVGRFAAYIRGRTVEKDLVIAYKQHLLREGYAISSINSMLASVNSLLDFSGWNDCKIRFFKVQRQSFCSAAKELTKEEYFH